MGCHPQRMVAYWRTPDACRGWVLGGGTALRIGGSRRDDCLVRLPGCLHYHFRDCSAGTIGSIHRPHEIFAFNRASRGRIPCRSRANPDGTDGRNGTDGTWSEGGRAPPTRPVLSSGTLPRTSTPSAPSAAVNDAVYRRAASSPPSAWRRSGRASIHACGALSTSGFWG